MRRLSLLSCLLLFSAAAQGAVTAGVAPVRLVEPADGAELLGGEIAVLRWEPTAAFADLGHAEEWEAFLSLDGGSTYAFRVTPHLEADRRTIWFQVPHFASTDARLLLRFGDERRETAVELPQSLRIRASTLSTAPWTHRDTADFARAASSNRSEPALPGTAGVVAWIEGDRHGNGWRLSETSSSTPALGDGQAPRVRESGHSEAGETGTSDPSSAPSTAATLDDRVPETGASSGPRHAPLPTPDILRLIQRQNE